MLQVVADIITEMTRKDVLSELLYADDLVLMSETIEGPKNKFLNWKGYERDVGEAVKQEEKICHDTETVREFTYIGDGVSPGGGCEAS